MAVREDAHLPFQQVLLPSHYIASGYVLVTFMRTVFERSLLTVRRDDGVWRVEHEGQTFGHSTDKEVAKAAANRRAREMQDAGRACQVQVHGEHGFFPA